MVMFLLGVGVGMIVGGALWFLVLPAWAHRRHVR